MITTAAALLVLTATVSQNPLEADFETGLGLAGLTPGTARFDSGILQFYRQGDGGTALFSSCYNDPWRAPFFVDMYRRQLKLASGRPVSLVEMASRGVGQGSRRSLLGDPAAPFAERARPNDSLTGALAKLKESGILKSAAPPTASLPSEVREAAAALIYAALALVDYRKAAFSEVADLSAAYTLFATASGEPDGPLAEARQGRVQRQVDTTVLYAAAQDMGAVASWAENRARLVPADKAYSWTVDTDWGRITLTGGSDTTHEGQSTFILIDTGGNDTFVNVPSNASASNWASIVLDTNGNDRYVSDPALTKTGLAEWPLRSKSRGARGPGSALFGVSYLLDTKGDDVYRSARSSMGSARFGVSYVGDYSGNDQYDAYADSQGFGHYGLGILDDTDGNDVYRCFTQSQGVGLPHGLGLLGDTKGDDTYVANDQVLDFPSAQSGDHNNSMAQGAGYGFRADYLTGHSQSGGVGILYDQQGDDTYSCGVFGQGVGYWEGAGFLWDEGGKDGFTGQWYVQGASAHFGLGYLEDGGGDDTYTALLNMAQGAGHDFSIGMLLDRAGTDKYQAPNLSLGAANANGIGVLLDIAGDDEYRATGTAIGMSNEAQKGSLRERALSLGVFLDLGGSDSYPDFAVWAKNGSRAANWNSKGRKPEESQVGVFLDR